MDTEIWRYAYVRRPYHQVVKRLAEARKQLLGEEEDTGEVVAYLSASVAGVAVSKATRLEAGMMRVGEESATLPLHWQAADHAGLFPTMEATLEVAPLEEDGRPLTQLGLVGRYQLPFGRAGQTGGALLGRRVVEQSVDGFLLGLVTRLESELPPETRRPRKDAGPSRASGQGRKIQIVLPDFRSRRGGLLAVKRRLAATPGVSRVQIRPGMAEVGYDPELVSVRAILAVFDEDVSQPPEPSQSRQRVP